MLMAAAASACFLGVIFSIAENMVPAEKFMPQIRVIFSLIFLLIILPPVARIGTDISIPDFSYDAADYTDTVDRLTDLEIRGNISDALGRILIENGYEPVKISVETNNSADGSISIIKAEIILTECGDIDSAAALVSSCLGIEPDKVEVKEAQNDGH